MDSSKFFNRKLNVRNPKSPYQKGNFVDESKNYKSRIFSRVKETSTTKSLLSIRRKVIQIENTLQSIFNLNKKSDKVKQRFAVIQVEDERNNKKIAAPSLGLGNLIQRPKTGAMDFISNFLTFTFLGWLFTKLQPLFSKLEGLLPILQGAFDFLGGTVKFLIDSFGSFIQFGYSVFDGIKGAHDGIKAKKDEFEKSFNDTTKALGDLIDGTVKVATSFLDVFKEPYNIADVGSKNENKTPAIGDFSSLSSISNLTATAFASGGNVGDGRVDPKSPITRGVDEDKRKKILKPKPSIQPQKTTPGKDVGGESKIKEIYGEQGENTWFNFGSLPSFLKTDKKSGYSALVSASEEYKKLKSDDILGIGNLMGASVDTALGQKPERRTYIQFTDGIKYLVNYAMTKPEEFNKINLEEMVRRIVEPKVENAINKIREEINKKSSAGTGPGPGGGGGLEGDGGTVESIDMGGFSDADIDALGRMIAAESAGESAIGKAGVLAVILNRYRLIKSGKASPQSFAITGKTREQVTIRDVLFAGGKGPGNQFSPYRDGNFDRTSSSSGKAALAEAIRAGGNDPEKFKQNLIKNGLSEEDADYVVRSVSFSNPRSRGSRPFKTKEVNVGNHVFQQSPNVKLTGAIGKVDAEITEQKKMLVEGGLLPSTRTITSYRGWRWGRMHRGVDYAGAGVDNQPISVIKPGKVVATGWDPNGGGNIVVIDHTDGTTTKYFHLANGSIKVSPGQNITTGQVIGVVGNTGRSTGTHLHFEVWKGGKDLNDPHKLADNYFRFGGNVKPAEVQKLAKKGGKEGYINHEGKFIEQKWAPEQKERFEKESKKETPAAQNPQQSQQQTPISTPGLPARTGEAYMINGKMYYVDTKGQGKVTDQSGAVIDFSGGKNQWLLKEIDTRRKLQKKKYGGVVYENSRKPMMPAEKYASYNDPMNTPQLVIQPIVIQTPVPVSSGSNSSIAFAIPKVNSTGKSKKLMRN
jgi:murein DD-endopeptidase MepM/ murein hydrolase activator NlpD